MAGFFSFKKSNSILQILCHRNYKKSKVISIYIYMRYNLAQFDHSVLCCLKGDVHVVLTEFYAKGFSFFVSFEDAGALSLLSETDAPLSAFFMSFLYPSLR